MKNLLFALLLLGVLSLNAQGTKNYIDQPYIEVRGSAKVELVPDEIYIDIEIKEDDSKGKVAIEDQELKMIDALEGIGVNVKKDLLVKDFSSNFKEYWYKKSGIRNRKNYQVKVNSGKMVGKLFYEMENIGISNIKVVKTNHSRIEWYKQNVKIKAVKAAKEKAAKLAEAIEQKIGKAIYIQEQNYRPYRRAEAANMVYKANAIGVDKEIADIDFEVIELEYEIFARFILE